MGKARSEFSEIDSAQTVESLLSRERAR
jgi:hypothetical protein